MEFGGTCSYIVLLILPLHPWQGFHVLCRSGAPFLIELHKLNLLFNAIWSFVDCSYFLFLYLKCHVKIFVYLTYMSWSCRPMLLLALWVRIMQIYYWCSCAFGKLVTTHYLWKVLLQILLEDIPLRWQQVFRGICW